MLLASDSPTRSLAQIWITPCEASNKDPTLEPDPATMVAARR